MNRSAENLPRKICSTRCKSFDLVRFISYKTDKTVKEAWTSIFFWKVCLDPAIEFPFPYLLIYINIISRLRLRINPRRSPSAPGARNSFRLYCVTSGKLHVMLFTPQSRLPSADPRLAQSSDLGDKPRGSIEVRYRGWLLCWPQLHKTTDLSQEALSLSSADVLCPGIQTSSFFTPMSREPGWVITTDNGR